MKITLGKKLGMTQVFSDSGEVIPVTRVLAGPCVVTQVREDKQSKTKRIQIGFGEAREKRTSKSEAGHLQGLDLVGELREFEIDPKAGAGRGDLLDLLMFVPGEQVTVSGESKGKGFAGVIKRHHFAGGPASHGHKDNARMPGAIGAGGVQRVFKGVRMAGRMGGGRVTVKNLQVVKVLPEINEIYIKGAIPGGRNAIVEIVGMGELKVKKVEKAASETAPAVSIEQLPSDNT